jgi:adenylate cyclase
MHRKAGCFAALGPPFSESHLLRKEYENTLTMKLRNRLIAGALVGLVFGALAWLGIGQSLEQLTADIWLRNRPDREAAVGVQLVAIDDEDIRQLGQWPIPRGAHVNVIQVLHALGAANTCFDIVFAEPSRDPEHDSALREIVGEAGNVTLAEPSADPGEHFLPGNRYGVDPDAPDFRFGDQPEPLFTDFDAALGAVNARQTSEDKLVRRIPLFISHKGKLHPSIAMQAVISAFKLEPDQIRIVPGKFVSLIGTPNGTIRIPIDDRCQLRVNFDSKESLLRRSHSYLDLFAIAGDAGLAGEARKDLEGSITFVGNASTGNTDVVLTRAGPLPGVVVQAIVAENILSGNFFRVLPNPLVAAIVLAVSMLVSLMVRGAHPWQSIFGVLLLTGIWTAVTLFAVRWGIILPYATVVIAAFGTLLILYPAQIKRVIDKFGGYVPQTLRTVLLSDSAEDSRPQRRELTIFFSDIRGFTNWSEDIDPDEVSEVLNEYLGAMADIVEAHKGTLDKFIGDCVMAFFGAPAPRKDHAEAALRMAWDMQFAIDDLNGKWSVRGRREIEVGMGLNTNFVTFGDFGSRRFRDYTVIGRGVNLAARIESVAPGGRILLSERTNTLVRDICETRLFAEIEPKGISGLHNVFEVMAIKGARERPKEREKAEWIWKDGELVIGPLPFSGFKVMMATGRITKETLLHHVDSDKPISVADLLRRDGGKMR